MVRNELEVLLGAAQTNTIHGDIQDDFHVDFHLEGPIYKDQFIFRYQFILIHVDLFEGNLHFSGPTIPVSSSNSALGSSWPPLRAAGGVQGGGLPGAGTGVFWGIPRLGLENRAKNMGEVDEVVGSHFDSQI